MKKVAFIILLVLGSPLGSCQCSNPPPVPPVEDEAHARLFDDVPVSARPFEA